MINSAHAADPTPGPPPSRLEGRVLRRGTMVPIADASLTLSTGATTSSDAEGRFSVEIDAAATTRPVDLVVSASGYETLRLSETLAAGIARTVEYRLLPLPGGADRYRSTVRGNANHEGERFTIRDEELRQSAGTGGDPFRVIGSLPGVIQPVPLLPVYIVRGGSPGMTGFFLDGMRVPLLFHLVFVDGVIHPRIIDRIDFYPGSYDVTFGRFSSGVTDAATRAARTDAPAHGEVELRLFDASALIELRLPAGVSVLAAGRYGFPGPLVHLFEPGVEINYWDYQLRADWRGLTLEAIGSFDSLKLNLASFGGRQNVDAQFLTTFHRVQLRDRFRSGPVEMEAALVGGLDRMTVLSGQGVQKLALSARFEARARWPWWMLQAGADAEISRYRGEQFTADGTAAAPDQLGELAGDRDGVVAGAFAQGSLVLDRLVGRPAAVTLGVRSDVYHAGPVTLLGIEPRLLFRYSPLPQLELFGGFGLYQQPPSFPVPLPGIDTFALQLGLQRAWQGSVGIKVKLPLDLSVSATGYFGKFSNMNDVVIDFVAAGCTSPPPESLTGIPAYITRQIGGAGYGMELLLRRQEGRVTGWIAYTLSRAERVYSCGLGPSDFDQAHVLNVALQVRLPWRLMAGGRLRFTSGRPYTQLGVDFASMTVSGSRNNARLPSYVQLDLRIDREWIFDRFSLAVFLEAINVTYAESVFGVTYPKDPVLMITRYDQPQIQGFRWVVPSLGVRGWF